MHICTSILKYRVIKAAALFVRNEKSDSQRCRFLIIQDIAIEAYAYKTFNGHV